LNSKGNERFVIIESSECLYRDGEDGPVCRIMTERGLHLPFDASPMPLCISHAYEFRGWTIDDTLDEIVNLIVEEDEDNSTGGE